MRMLSTGIDLEFAILLAAHLGLRQHALDRLADDHIGLLAVEILVCRAGLDAAGIARVPVVGLVITLVAGEADLVSIDHDNMVATIDVRGVHRLVLAAQTVRDNRCHAAKHYALGVDDPPL